MPRALIRERGTAIEFPATVPAVVGLRAVIAFRVSRTRLSQITYLTNFVNPTGLLLKGLLLTDLMNEEKIDSKKRKKRTY